MPEPFNPLDMLSLAQSIHIALLDQEPVPMESVPQFEGAGIYAIYYVGRFPAYSLLAEANAGGDWTTPIYVGKAIPEGGRKGILGIKKTSALSKRLKEHRGSVEAAANLDAADFYVRWLVVEPIWIPLGESLLINRYVPVWNSLIDGFGNHMPGGGRDKTVASKWDVLHPGRSWSTGLLARSLGDQESIASEASDYLLQRIPPK